MTKKILRLMGNIVIILLVVIVISTFFSILKARKDHQLVPSIAGYKIMTVLTGSMRPAIQPGDLIFSRNADKGEIQEGDIITFRADEQTLVTHRVIEVLEESGDRVYKTKGDANSIDDQKIVRPQDIVGSLVFRIPKGGYILKFMQGPVGFIVLFLLPIILLIKGEFKNLVSDIGKKDKRSV